MADINQIITLGIGAPAGIPPFITVGFVLGGATATVPDVVGDDEATGTATLEGDGFVVEVQNAYSGSVAAGDIISQLPIAGATAAIGSTVIIVVSIGAAPAQGDRVRDGRRRGRVIQLFGRG